MKGWHAAVLVSLLVGGFYAATYDFRPITDTRLNSLQTRAMVLHGDFDLYRYAERYDVDAFTMAIPRDGELHSAYGIGISAVASPVYLLLTRLGASEAVLHGSVSILYAAAAVAVLYLLLLRRHPPGVALGAALVFAFGTTMWPVGTTGLWQQTPVLFLQSLGLWAVFARGAHMPYLAGATMGLAVWVRPATALVFLATLAIYVTRGRREVGPFVLAGALPIAALLVQNLLMWDSVVQGGYQYSPDYYFGTNLRESVPGFFFGWWRGLFVYTPFFLLVIASMTKSLKHRSGSEVALFIFELSAIATLLLYTFWGAWWGGQWQYGYRLPLDVAPILLLSATAGAVRISGLKAVSVALAAISILIMTVGSLPDRMGWDHREFPESLSRSPLGEAMSAALDQPFSVAARIAGMLVIAGALYLLTRRHQPIVES